MPARSINGTVLALLVAFGLLATPLSAQAPVLQDRVDLDAVSRIKDEGLQRTHVMDTAWYLTDVHGPRLTNSPAIRAAAAWATKRLGEWGLSNVRQETWGPFGRGWANERFVASAVSPQSFPLIGFPRAWTPGTNGSITADVVAAQITNDEGMKTWTGKLRGMIVLSQPLPEMRALYTPIGRRFSDQDLVDLQSQPVAVPSGRVGGPPPNPNFRERLVQFFIREGVVATLEPANGRSDHGTILVANAPREYRDPKTPTTLPQIMIASEHYNRIARLAQKQIPVRVSLDVQNRFVDDTTDSFNIVAELPGTDKADEIVMLGAHFDSWHSGTGATDNAAGSAAMMEAIRILKATGLRMRRTVRLALWTGEEQGLLGSRAYVRQQFADVDTMALKPAHAKLSAYFNMDNGTGAIRGVYLQDNEAVRPIFDAWMTPLRSLGMTMLTIRATGSTDHVPFDEVGLPGFQFVQDPIEYSTLSHHSNMDLYDRLQPEDLMKNSVIIASFVYHAANRDALLPRKALPKPRAPASSTAR